MAPSPLLDGPVSVAVTTASPRSSYEVDRFRTGDRSAFLSLYETVFGHRRSPEWFRWKYESNPVVDGIPITVARHGDDLVGCRSFLPLSVAVGGEHHVAFQPCDTMVHPDHRRRGLFTRMNERAIERYADGPPAFFFNFPNANSKPGNLSMGWRPVARVPMYYRPQNATTAMGRWLEAHAATDGGPAVGVTESAVGPSPLASIHRALDQWLLDCSDDRVDRYDRPESAPLEAVYHRAIPDGVHAVRDEAFYRWRFANPAHEYEVYVATRRGAPVAAAVVSPVDDHLRLVDTLPRRSDAEREAIERAVVAALADHAGPDSDVGYVAAFGSVLARPLRYRFYPDLRPPLNSLLRPTSRTLLARDLPSSPGVERRPPTAWTLSWFDLDAV